MDKDEIKGLIQDFGRQVRNTNDPTAAAIYQLGAVLAPILGTLMNISLTLIEIRESLDTEGGEE